MNNSAKRSSLLLALLLCMQGLFGYTSEDCFIAGTLVTMADGSRKPIEEVVVGEYVQTYNTEESILESGRVNKTYTTFHGGSGDDQTVRIAFSDGRSNQNTNSQPYYVLAKDMLRIGPI